MTNKKLTNRQAISVLDGLWSNPLFGEAHRQAFEIGIKAIKSLEQEPWIPVSEKLPEEGKTVIASTDYFAVFPEARYTKDGWEWAYESGADYWEELAYVIAWMPLPKPYKAESEK